MHVGSVGTRELLKPGQSNSIEILIDLWAKIVDDHTKENMNDTGQDSIGKSGGTLGRVRRFYQR